MTTSGVLVELRLIGSKVFAAEAEAAGASLNSVAAGSDRAAAGMRRATVAADSEGGALARVKGASAAAAAPLRRMGAVAGVALGAIGVEGVKYASDFQSEMVKLHTQVGASTREVKRMKQPVLDLAGTVPQGPGKLAEALYHVEAIGLRGKRALGALHSAAKGAALGSADLTDTTRALTATLASGIKGARNTDQAMGALEATAASGNIRFGDLAQSLSSGVLPAAKQSGVSLKQLGAMLATLSEQGIPAQQAARRLRTALMRIDAPTQQGIKALGTIGLQAKQLGHIMLRQGPVKALETLRAHLHAFSKDPVVQKRILTEAFGGVRGSGIVTALMGTVDKAGSGLRARLGRIGHQTNNFNDRWRAFQRTFKAQSGEFEASIQKTFVAIGDAILPTLTRILKGFNNMLTAGTVHKIGAVFGGALSGILNAAKAVAGALGPLIGQLINAFKPAMPFVSNVFLPLLKGVAEGILGAVVGAVKIAVPVIRGLATVLGFVGRALAPLRPVIQGVGVALGVVFGPWILKAISEVGRFGKVIGLLRVPLRFAGRVMSGLGRIVGRLVGWFTRGVTWVNRFAHMADGGLARVVGSAANMVAGIISKVEALPGRMLALARKAANWLGHGLLSAARGIAAQAGHIGTAIVDGIVRMIEAAPGKIVNAIKSLVPGPIRGVVGSVTGFLGGVIPGHASGGTVRTPGVQLVGERGPELATLPVGTRVTPAAQTARILAERPAPSVLSPQPVYHVTFAPVLDGRVLHRSVFRVERGMVEAR